MNLKTAIVVLVVVVGLFVAALVIGARQDDGGDGGGDSTDSNSLVDRLGELVGDPSAVPRDAVSASCVDDEDPDLLVIPGGLVGGCRVVVQNADTLRLLHIAALTDIVVEAPAPEGDLEVSDDVAAGEEAKVAIGQGDGQTAIDLSCTGLATGCQARLVAE